MDLEFSRQILEKYSNIEFPFSGDRITLCCIDCPFYIVVSCLGCAVVSCLVCTVVVVLSVLLSSHV
jgi:hypothetical protein